MTKVKLRIGGFVYVPSRKLHGTVEGFEMVGKVRYAVIYFLKTDRIEKIPISEIKVEGKP